MTTTQAQTIGQRPVGHASGSERWASITEDDGLLTVTAYRGWNITDQVHMHGRTAVTLAETIAQQLIHA